MTKQANFFRIGLFILIGIFLLFGGLVLFGLGQFLKPKIEVETYVDGTVQGIEIGSPVKLRGVPVGKVTDIGFVFMEYPLANQSPMMNYVRLLMEIDREIFPGMFDRNLQPALDKAIKQGLRIRIEPQGVTGVNYLEINYLEASRFQPISIPWTPRLYYIPSAPGEVTSILDSVNRIMRDMEKLNVESISKNLVASLKKIRTALDKGDLGKTSQSIQEASRTFSDAVKSANLGEVSTKARTLLTELGTSNRELAQILSNLEPTSRIDADAVASTLSNLQAISDNLRTLTEDLERDPSRLIWSRPTKSTSLLKQNKKQPKPKQ